MNVLLPSKNLSQSPNFKSSLSLPGQILQNNREGSQELQHSTAKMRRVRGAGTKRSVCREFLMDHSVRITVKYVRAVVGLCNMPWWVILCGLRSCKKSSRSHSFLDKKIEEGNILMCFLTPLGANFKCGVTGSNTNKPQSHHSCSATVCSTWFGEVLKKHRGAADLCSAPLLGLP